MNERLQGLSGAGQSVRIDFLSRNSMGCGSSKV